MGLIEAIILAVLAASTPLLLAATGELMTERSGVLNLGVEGMMIVGAACGFGGAWLSGSVIVGALCGIAAGILMSLDWYLREKADPTGAELREFLGGHICRCTGYVPIVAAALDAAKRLRQAGEGK